MTAVVLDTDHLSLVLQRRQPIYDRIVARLDQLPPDEEESGPSRVVRPQVSSRQRLPVASQLRQAPNYKSRVSHEAHAASPAGSGLGHLPTTRIVKVPGTGAAFLPWAGSLNWAVDR